MLRTLHLLRQMISALLLLVALPVSAAEHPNVLLISIDTLRADALTSYGFRYDTSPTIDRLARRGVLFEDTSTTIGKTGPAISSLFTSLYPPTHGARRNGVPMRPDVPVMAELLKEQGFETAAFVTNWTLRSNLSGVDRGFDLYDQKFNKSRYMVGPNERDAPTVTRAVLSWLQENRSSDLENGDDPLFLWVHYSEPHTPYKLHKDLATPKPRDADRDRWIAKRWRYDSEVAYLDLWINKLLEGVEPYLPAEDTLIVIVSDHGESIGEHDYWGHGKNTHWPNLKIPFIISGPDVPRGKRVSGPASIVDVMPTVLALIGAEAPKSIVGLDLTPYFDRGINPSRFRYSFGDRATARGEKVRDSYGDPLQIALETKGVKAIYDFKKRRVQYFDLANDQREVEPLQSPPSETNPLIRRELVSWYKELAKYQHSTGEELEEEDLEQLRSLGYVGN